MKPYYEKKKLESAVRESISFREVIFKLNLKYNGGVFSMVKFYVKKHGIDTSHFLGQGHCSGEKYKSTCDRLTPEQIFVVNRRKGLRENVKYLRLALDSLGIERKCSECRLGEKWNDKPLTLQIEHINGNFLDNRKENLCYLCPNCHTQTKTWGSKKRV